MNSFNFQVLRFFAWYKQTVHESPDEHFRVRHVNIYYYLEDDSIAVVEPHVENSGMPQGGSIFSTPVREQCIHEGTSSIILWMHTPL